MEKMSIINSPFQKVGQQIEAIYALRQHQITGASNANLTTASSRKQFDSEITTAMLESEAFNIPVSRLIDVWVARFGNKWVDLETLEGDEFFNSAFKRLRQLGEVEVHFLTDRARYVCRMPEQ
jgi:hypothetical protein